ncbi:hypothetical protein [Stenotrophomonas sp. TD3]|uniref:hypothetical protein n=1 Tax=Stenotrophomonas sp. TD3 TaxID=1641707 RepID=UPI000B2ED770|nr:hypothetical protein [Stenotrophomonas sp. TD3]
MSAPVRVTDSMVHAFDDAYSKNWEAQRCAPEGTNEQGTFFATRAGLEAALSAHPSPAMESMGKRKLHQLQGDGFIVNGVAIFNPETGRRGLVDNLGYVGWMAQPSPGGQGDALLESLVARWRNHAEEIGVSDNLLCQKIANCTMRHAAELQAALAARQPVGEPVTPWRDHSAAVDSKALATATEIALMWGKDRSQFVSRIQAAVIDAMQWMNGGLLEKPAQAEDLGQFREAVQEAYENADAGTLNKFSLEELLVLIDSQAVGNG